MSKVELSISDAIKYLRTALKTEDGALEKSLSDAVLGHGLMDKEQNSSFLPERAAACWPSVKIKFDQMIRPAKAGSNAVEETQGELDLDWRVKLDNIPRFSCGIAMFQNIRKSGMRFLCVWRIRSGSSSWGFLQET